MKCRKCGTENIAGAKFCRHCGTNLADVENVMDIYPKLNFVPTNFMDWKKPWVGMFIKGIMLIPFLFSVFICLCGFWSYFNYNQNSGNFHYDDSLEDKYCYSTFIRDAIFDGMFRGRSTCFRVNGIFYENYYVDDIDDIDDYSLWKPRGNYVSNPLEYTKLEALDRYHDEIAMVCIPNSIICLVSLFIFIICGYPKRPKNTKPLHEVADYCQKYSYLGIFRRRKTPKYVFFVKDNLFGILDVAHYSVFLPARYDYLSWREKNKYLNASIDGRYCIIDIYGKELK